MVLLLQSFGIIPSIKYDWGKKSKHLAYIIRISGIQQLEKLKSIFGIQGEERINEILQKYEKRIRPHGYKRKEGFAILEITEKNVKNSAEYVYSVETSTNTLITNSGLVVHNCLPKDVNAIVAFSNQKGLTPSLMESVLKRNYEQAIHVVDLMEEELGNLKDKRIAVLGLAFKPNTDDMRQAPSIKIIDRLIERGVKEIVGFDPRARETAREILKDKITYASTVEECLKDANACILVTEWDQFKSLTPDFFKSHMRTPILIDGRRVYDPELFSKELTYRAIGRG
jgi:UDPglucose 6-dehydrogenase